MARDAKRSGMEGLEFGDVDEKLDNAATAIARDGGILGDPEGYRFATGKRNVDVREAGCEMLRGRHRDGRDPG